jgi:hypothetical protein
MCPRASSPMSKSAPRLWIGRDVLPPLFLVPFPNRFDRFLRNGKGGPDRRDTINRLAILVFVMLWSSS